MFDGKAFGEEMVGIVKAYVDRQLATVIAENLELKNQVAEFREQLSNVQQGAQIEVLRPIIVEEVAKAVAQIPPAETPEPITPDMEEVRAHILEAVAALPPALPGKSITVEELQPLIMQEVTKAVGQIPVPKDGIGLAGAIIDRDGNLVITLTDGTAKELGPVVGRDADMDLLKAFASDMITALPKPQNGKDAFSLDDFDIERIDERTLKFKFERGSELHTYELSFPVMIYRGVFLEGKTYEQGDAVTWGGSLWHCDEVTSEKPGEGSKSWRLAVKRGRDAKDVAKL